MSDNLRPCSHHVWYTPSCDLCERVNRSDYKPLFEDNEDSPLRMPGRSAPPRFYGALADRISNNTFPYGGNQVTYNSPTYGPIVFGDFPPALRHLTIPGAGRVPGVGPAAAAPATASDGPSTSNGNGNNANNATGSGDNNASGSGTNNNNAANNANHPPIVQTGFGNNANSLDTIPEKNGDDA